LDKREKNERNAMREKIVPGLFSLKISKLNQDTWSHMCVAGLLLLVDGEVVGSPLEVSAQPLSIQRVNPNS
jgi:hypothetical protein